MIKKFFATVILVALSLSCVPKKITVISNPPAPETVLDIIDSLSLKSFDFNINFENPNVKSASRGIFTEGRVKVKGWRKFENSKESIDAVGIDETEYKKEKGKWIEGTRTYDTQPVELLKIICKEGEPEFSETRNGFFIYKFTPNLLFIDPSLMENPKAAEGEIWINGESLLPDKILTKSKTSKWNMELKNFGKKINILNPGTKSQKIRIHIKKDAYKITRLLKQRLESCGIDGEFRLNGKEIILEFYLENAFQKELIQQGKLELYAAEYPKQSIYDTKGVRFVLGDSTKPVLLRDKIINNLVNCSIDDYEKDKSNINLEFEKDLPETTKIAVVVDNEIIGLIPQTWGKSLKIKCTKEIAVKIKFPFPSETSVLDK